MQKKLIIITLFLCLFISSCSMPLNDAKKFKQEYESLNNQENIDGKKYQNITIDKDNPVVYKTAGDIVKMINDKESFIVYFGYNSCPWCRSVVPTLLDVAKDMELESLYYVDIKEIRNTLNGLNGKAVEKEKGTNDYYKLLNLLKNVLDDYSLTDADGNIVETNQKRIYAPNIIAIVDGVATKMTTGISDKQDDAYMKLTENMLKESYDKIEEVINEVASSVCTQDSGC